MNKSSKQNRLIIFSPGWSEGCLSLRGHKYSYADYFLSQFRYGYDVLAFKYKNRGLDCIYSTAKFGVSKYLSDISRAYEHIVFIGHSMGGLVGRVLIQELEYPIDSYISLATPHTGTKKAYLAQRFVPNLSSSAAQMCPGSDFLVRLNEKPWPTRTRALSLQASYDSVIVPSSSAIFSHAENIKIPHTTHLSLVFSRRTSQEIYAWLTYEVFGETGNNDKLGFLSTTLLD